MRNFSAAVKFRHKFFEGLTETCTKKKDLNLALLKLVPDGGKVQVKWLHSALY